MGLRPTQGDENGFCSATALHGSVALPFVIPTGAVAKWRDLRFSRPLLEMFFDRADPDFLLRSASQRRVCGPGQPGPHEVPCAPNLNRKSGGATAVQPFRSHRLFAFLRGTLDSGDWSSYGENLSCCQQAIPRFQPESLEGNIGDLAPGTSCCARECCFPPYVCGSDGLCHCPPDYPEPCGNYCISASSLCCGPRNVDYWQCCPEGTCCCDVNSGLANQVCFRRFHPNPGFFRSLGLPSVFFNKLLSFLRQRRELEFQALIFGQKCDPTLAGDSTIQLAAAS
jgi:hypothetical protein